jgi:hypothetical protein
MPTPNLSLRTAILILVILVAAWPILEAMFPPVDDVDFTNAVIMETAASPWGAAVGLGVTLGLAIATLYAVLTASWRAWSGVFWWTFGSVVVLVGVITAAGFLVPHRERLTHIGQFAWFGLPYVTLGFWSVFTLAAAFARFLQERSRR